MAEDDPIRQAHTRATARSQELARRLFGVEPLPPVKRPDGTVYDGTGEKPTTRDVVAQVDDHLNGSD